ncbi:GNAT family N-acetyltransferase [Paraglaciecola arctica]|uniref:Diamine acetyltransferase 2 n=1 Tax=Paraglaciecola arctica BSs20135 TaxID=493475 RepID=K6Y4W1_9ALTE|nr:GNAT family N-acetyltransferase [Paraglaciecola arctica]GAC19001.1 diamine acetyltransferase 2 [Paraglaciecola arctica BSs20135]
MVIVREATISDVDIVHELIMAIAKYHGQEQYVITSKMELINAGFAENPSFGVLIAEIDGKVAGYCSYTWNYSIWAGSVFMNIDDVFVWEKYRGQSVGEKLMLKAKDVCSAKGASRIRWEVEQDNLKAIKFYKRLGADFDIKGFFRWDIAS